MLLLACYTSNLLIWFVYKEKFLFIASLYLAKITIESVLLTWFLQEKKNKNIYSISKAKMIKFKRALNKWLCLCKHEQTDAHSCADACSPTNKAFVRILASITKK